MNISKRIMLQILSISILLILVAGCGKVDYPAENDQNDQSVYLPPESMVYEPDLYGATQAVEVADLLVEFCGIDPDREDNLKDADTLEYWSSVYDPDTDAFLYATHVRIRGLSSEHPDIRYDDNDGYALIATIKGVWVRESGSDKFELDNTFGYDRWLYEESIYLKAISLWDKSSKLFTPSSPASGSLVLLEKINIDANLDESLFKTKGD